MLYLQLDINFFTNPIFFFTCHGEGTFKIYDVEEFCSMASPGKQWSHINTPFSMLINTEKHAVKLHNPFFK